ncbi:MAG TPA: ABC-F family ATP-binding cassette domain-containing protein [bacterium]|nr:ABC-F family ATP-binding cassette domain-containing protein [bacterium]
MIVVSLHDIRKSFPAGGDVLTGVDWEIHSGQKIALVGRNGSGKTTLMGIVVGRMEADSGTRTLGRGVRIVEMSQIPDRSLESTLYDYVLDARRDLLDLRHRVVELAAAVAENPDDADRQERLGQAQHDLEHSGAYGLETQVERVLTGLSFPRERWRDSIARFSGGERTRAELARLLLTPADLLLLDEPTNHLDIPAVEWLEQYLIEAPFACVLVSHDRVFLERFAGRVVELVNGTLEQYDGNYLYYRAEKPKRIARRQKAYEIQQAEIARIEDFIARNLAGQKTRQAQSKRLALSKLERLERPTEDTSEIKLGFQTARRSFREVLVVKNLTRRLGGRVILDRVSFTCERNDKIGVIGPNGAGKTTLLRAIVGLDNDYDGQIRLGERVEIGYFDQHLDTLDGSGSVIDEIWNEHPSFEAGPLRSYLARFLFTGEDVFKRVADLSGGEKNRLALAKLMLTKANFLVMDEPTNHLDVAAREVLEEAIAEFDGTALIVSHDRRFLDRFATKILYVGDGNVSLSLGHYSDWAARRDAARAADSAASPEVSVSEAARDWEERKRERARTQKRERQRREIESAITALEARIAQLEAELSSETIARDWERLAALTEERARKYEEMEQWLTRLDEFIATGG